MPVRGIRDEDNANMLQKSIGNLDGAGNRVQSEERVNTMNNVERILQNLGVMPNYTGYFQTLEAVELCVESPERLTLITKQVYMEVGRRCGVKWTAVERNIRTAAGVAWERNRPLLEEIVGCALETRPCASDFVAALTVRAIASELHGEGVDILEA